MLTAEQVAALRKGDTIYYVNKDGQRLPWTVDYPKQLINEKKKITVYENTGENNTPRRVALETPAGGGECTNSEKGCIRVSMLTPTGRGHNRFSMLVTNFDNWEVEGENSGQASSSQNSNQSQASQNQVVSPLNLIQLTPAPNAIDVAIDANIVLTFNGNVKLGEGKVNLSAGDVNTSLNMTSVAEVSNSTVTITLPDNILEPNTEYTITFDSNAILDTNNALVNVLDTNVYKFTTINN